ncbi:MAG: hypothetical protein KKA60_00365 [Proteobacteria bacterium]|nr:hypothetical protein [Pseudomonadota bacterium]
MSEPEDLDNPESWERDLDDVFADLGDARVVEKLESEASGGMIESLHEEEGRLDPWRKKLVHLVYELAGFLRFSRELAGDAEAAGATRVAEALFRLDEMPNHDGRVLIRHRGRLAPGEDEGSRNRDYEVLFGAIILDAPRVRMAAQRLGRAGDLLHETFTEACGVLAEAGVNTVYAVCSSDPPQRKKLATCLEALAAFLGHEAADEETRDPEAWPHVIISDETRRANVNFTLLAATNNLKRGTAQVLVNQVDAMMRRAGARDPLLRYTGVYDAVFAFRKLWGVLSRPPLEVNNLKWLVTDHAGTVVNESLAQLVRLVGREFGEWNQKSGRIVDALTAGDYGLAPAEEVCERLGLVTGLLHAMEISASGGDTSVGQADHVDEATMEAVVRMMQSRLARLSDDTLGEIFPETEILSCQSSDDREIRIHVDARLMDLVHFYRRRAAVNRKMKSLLAGAGEFDRADYEVVAADFGISAENAAELVGLLKACFDAEGHFAREAFEKNIPAFCRHERDVFGFLWHYLKEHMDTGDRLALLNSLQLLINRMKNPNRALEVLLAGVFANPENVTFADRNALILANVLLRKFNKELLKDTKMTPEEVLHVVDGLDAAAAAHVRGILEGEREKTFIKVRTIHRMLKAALDPYAWHKSMPLGYLLTLEREIYLLLALVEGPVARAVLYSALWEYGNPDSSIYGSAEREDQLMWLYHILQVVIRGMGRVGEPADADALLGMKEHARAFLSKSSDPKAREQVKRFLAWAEKSAQALAVKVPAEPGE